MKKVLSLVLSLLLIAFNCVTSVADPLSSEAFRKGFIEAVTHGTPISSHEFLLYYMIRADNLGVDIGSYKDYILDTGSQVNLQYVGLSIDPENNVLRGYFKLPRIGDGDYIEASLCLISFVYAFIRFPSMDDFYEMVGEISLITGTADIQAIYASSKEKPLKMDNYNFYCEDDMMIAEFIRR